MPRADLLRRSDGQASVELVAVLPLVAIVVALLWQAVVAGHVIWATAVTARAAAREIAVHGEARAARRLLPGGGAIRVGSDGRVAATAPVPVVIAGGRISLGSVTSRARFEAQR